MTTLTQITKLFTMIFKPFQVAILMALPVWYIFFTVWVNTNIWGAMASFWAMTAVSGILLYVMCQAETLLEQRSF